MQLDFTVAAYVKNVVGDAECLLLLFSFLLLLLVYLSNELQVKVVITLSLNPAEVIADFGTLVALLTISTAILIATFLSQLCCYIQSTN